MTPEDQENIDATQRKIQEMCTVLKDYCDTIYVFCTARSLDDSSTFSIHQGQGNFYAIRGQVAEWLMVQDQNAGNFVGGTTVEPPEEDDEDESWKKADNE